MSVAVAVSAPVVTVRVFVPLPNRITGLVRISAVIVLPDITGSPTSVTLPSNVTVVVASNVQPAEAVTVMVCRRPKMIPVCTVLGLTVIVHGGFGTTVNASAQMMAVEPVAPPVTVTLQVAACCCFGYCDVGNNRGCAVGGCAVYRHAAAAKAHCQVVYCAGINACQRNRHITGKPCIH